ncbi:LptA/OstA family protein [Azospirillum isscasi]|uniref:LptA/OstA family protein n=1 Tax=Azospirillum isscasi TaxID=3053926 RepID=A0ABU0WIF9_9PROT|nr:LptA/OstA family protein [Azospirillum isscasi]MDQ2104010.1 LptA/OstA family protein [Azospirillum isscasi]
MSAATRAAIFAAPLLAAILLLPGASVPAAAQGLPGLGGGPNPVEVDADQAIEWHQDVRAYVARGNASAKRNDSTVFADVLTAYYREVPGKGNEVFQLLAEGNVRIVSPTQEVFGERGVYDVDKQVAVVTGRNLKLVTRTDIVTARDTLEYYEARNLTVARGDAVAVRISNGDRLRADILIGQLKKMPDGSTQMERIDGAGSVVVTTATDVALSDKLVYSVADDTAVLLGNVKITRNDNQLNGDAAEMNMKTKVNRVIAGPATGGRVMGLLIPGQEQGAPGAAPAGQGGKPTAPAGGKPAAKP